MRINHAALCGVPIWEKYQASSIYVRKERMPTRFIKRIVYSLEELKPPEWAQRNQYNMLPKLFIIASVCKFEPNTMGNRRLHRHSPYRSVGVNSWTNKTTNNLQKDRTSHENGDMYTFIDFFYLFKKGLP